MSSWLDNIIACFGIQVKGIEQTPPSIVDFRGGVSASASGDKLTLEFADGNTTAQYLLAAADSSLPNAKVISGSNGITLGGRTDECVISPTYGTAINTVCQGNDQRLNTRWRKGSTLTHADSWSGNLPTWSLRLPFPVPRVGLPVRIVDRRPIAYGDTYSNYSGGDALFGGITGNLEDYADDHGMIYPSLVSDGSGYFHLALYSDAARTILFGHTATFNAVGDLAFIANNGCALTGTITIAGTLTANSTASLQIYKYGILNSVDLATGAIIWDGAEIASGTGAIWIGDPELVRAVRIAIPGTYASATTSQAIYDRTSEKLFWDFGTAHLIGMRTIHGTADSTTQPKISLVHNGTPVNADVDAYPVSTSRTFDVASTLDTSRRIEPSNSIELRVQKLGTGNAAKLSAVAVYVLE